MAEIKKIYRQSMPAMKFVGRHYGEDEKVNGTFSCLWEQWFKDNLFAPLQLPGDEPFEDCNAYYGLCRCKDGEPLQYWIGVFMPPDAAVPEGYESIDFDPFDIVVCWIYGKEPDVYIFCSLSRLAEEGYNWTADKDGIKWCFERYVSPRFTQPDENGNIILDMCYRISE